MQEGVPRHTITSHRALDSPDLVRGDPPEPEAGETAPLPGKQHRRSASFDHGCNRSRRWPPGGTNALFGGCGAGTANSNSPSGEESISPPWPMAAGSGNPWTNCLIGRTPAVRPEGALSAPGWITPRRRTGGYACALNGRPRLVGILRPSPRVPGEGGETTPRWVFRHIPTPSPWPAGTLLPRHSRGAVAVGQRHRAHQRPG